MVNKTFHPRLVKISYIFVQFTNKSKDLTLILRKKFCFTLLFHVDITSLICHFARGFIGFVCIYVCVFAVSQDYILNHFKNQIGSFAWRSNYVFQFYESIWTLDTKIRRKLAVPIYAFDWSARLDKIRNLHRKWMIFRGNCGP